MPTYGCSPSRSSPSGVTALTFITAANSTMQLGVDPVMRGRVMALYMAVFFGGTPIGAPLVGAVAEAFGARWSLLAGGLVSATAAVVCAGPGSPGAAASRSAAELRDRCPGSDRQAPSSVVRDVSGDACQAS